MAAGNLLDTIRENSNSLASQQQGNTDEIGKLQTLLRAKSGKAIGGSDVGASNLGEQAANDQTNLTMRTQVQPQAQIQGQQQQQQQSQILGQERQQTADIAQSVKFDNIQNKIKTDQILSDLERNKGQLDLARDGASLEQVAFNLRLQNNQYVDNLKTEGAKQRLNSDLEFKNALTKSVMNDNQELLEKQMGNKSILAASDRDFKKAMGQMDIDTAYDMFTNDMKAQKQRALWSSLGALTGAGIAAGGTYADQSDKSNYYNNTTAGKNTKSYEASKYRDEL